MKIKTAAIQMHTVPDKMENIRTAGAYIEKVSAQKPDFVILPEMFCCPYQTGKFSGICRGRGRTGVAGNVRTG